jgi:transposase
MVYVIRHALMWKDVPRGFGPDKTRYHAPARWSR